VTIITNRGMVYNGDDCNIVGAVLNIFEEYYELRLTYKYSGHNWWDIGDTGWRLQITNTYFTIFDNESYRYFQLEDPNCFDKVFLHIRNTEIEL